MIDINRSCLKILLLICTLIFGIVIITGCSSSGDTASSSSPTAKPLNTSAVYESPQYNIKINNPKRWVIKDDISGLAAMFLIPQENNSNTFEQNVNIVVQDLSNTPMNLEKYTEISLDNAKKAISGFNLISSDKATLAGNPAQKVVFTAKQEKNNLKLMQIWTIKNMSAYIITYSIEEDKFSNYLGTVEEMANSFEIK